MNDGINWHERFMNQLKWTKELREYIYKIFDFSKYKKILEIGCGTGALLLELGQKFDLELYGLDMDSNRIELARKNLKLAGIQAEVRCEEILQTSYKNQSFGAVVTNLFFLWIKKLEPVFQKIYDLLVENGVLIIFAEPDYGGLIEYPETGLKEALVSNLRRSGANPNVGRMLSSHFKDKFKVIGEFSPTIPWMASNNKEALLQESAFFNELLKKEIYDRNKLVQSIEDGSYFIYNPSFSFVLQKI